MPDVFDGLYGGSTDYCRDCDKEAELDGPSSAKTNEYGDANGGTASRNSGHYGDGLGEPDDGSGKYAELSQANFCFLSVVGYNQ